LRDLLTLSCRPTSICSFAFTATATTEIYTLSLHDALPICTRHVALRELALRSDERVGRPQPVLGAQARTRQLGPQLRVGLRRQRDRKSTRLNSSHVKISYAVFCLKKKKENIRSQISCRD